MQWTLKRNVAPNEFERIRKEIASQGVLLDMITFPGPNLVRVEGAAGMVGAMIENKLNQMGLF